MVMKKFYVYTQNNSGGSFVVNDKLTHSLYIEASSQSQADSIAEDMGVYFNGCDKGWDCPCCGDRWYSGSLLEFPYEYGAFSKKEGTAIAERYGCETIVKTGKRVYGDRDTWVVFPNVEVYAQYMADNYAWCDPDGRIFYADGTVKEIRKETVEG